MTKTAAEDLCELFARKFGLPCLTLRTSRFFLEADDNPGTRAAYADANAKANEFLYRRVEIEDVATAHQCALEKAPALKFGRYIISATTPFTRDDLAELRNDAAAVVRRYAPDYEAEYARRNWRMFPSIERVYVNERARVELGWQPRYDFQFVLDCLRRQEEPRSALSLVVGSKGYHAQSFLEGPYPIE